MDSVWTISAQLPSFEPLKEDIKTDVLIIGGGLAGLLCAWRLKQAGVDVALVEADTICSGITKNTTAKITSQHGLIYDVLIRKMGAEKAKLYLQANQNALQQYRELCRLWCIFSRLAVMPAAQFLLKDTMASAMSLADCRKL